MRINSEMNQSHIVFLFGDQTTDVYPSIRHVIEQSRKSRTLRRFLQDANQIVQTEVANLTEGERDNVGSFVTLDELAEQYSEKEDLTGLAHNVLLCVTRLGELLLYLENDRRILESSGSDSHILAFCAGLLPAAAAAAATDANELVSIGVEIVAITFRLFLELWRRSASIEGKPGCWGYSIAGCTTDCISGLLEEFHLSESIPLHRHAYIAVESQTRVSLFGPPATLAQLFAWSPILEAAPKVRLRAYGAAHAAKLPAPDTQKILGSSPVLDLPINSGAKILSTSTCKPFVTADLRTLLQQVLHDIFARPMRFDNTIEAAVSNFPENTNVKLLVVGPTSHTPAVRKTFQSHGVKVQVLERPEAPLGKVCYSQSDLVAIVGMSGRFPGSDNVQDFWESLLRAEDLHTTVPDNRFDLNVWYDKTASSRNSTSVPYGCFLGRPGAFDSRFFSISPREAAQMDPTQRLMLMASYEALETAGYSQEGAQEQRIATFLGQTTDDWRDINHQEGVDIYYVPATQRSFGPGRIHHHFQWEGPTYSVDSACASSATAVSLAYSALVNREADMTLAGGGAIIASPMPLAGVGRGSFLSETGACKTFRADADGYCRGEGVGVVVMKRLDDALAANDNIMAVISAAARNHSALASSITHPHAGAQQRLYRQALRQAGVDAKDISYVEMHGTGTQAGDVCEMSSVIEVFAKGRTETNPLILGAVKACVGHGEAAAGITGLIKAVLMLQKSEIPPQPGLQSNPLNPAFPPLDKMNVHIADRPMSLEAPSTGDGTKRLLVNNFDAAGGNTCLVLEEPPTAAPPAREDPRTHHIIACSAHCTKSLRENQERLLAHLNDHPATGLCDLAYTTTCRRMHHQMRSACAAESIDDVLSFLNAELASPPERARAGPGTKVPVGFVFTGQGAQYAGMGSQLFATCARFRSTVRGYQQICDMHGFPSFIELVAETDGDLAANTTVQTQLAVVALEMALADVWRSWGVRPDWVLGHSLGEYAALHVAGVLSVSDALYLVGQRALAVQEKCSPGEYAMLAVSLDAGAVERVIAAEPLGSCEVACMNSPRSTVCSGKNEDIEKLRALLGQKHETVKTQLLKIPFGFHSSQLEPMLDEFKAKAQGVQFERPSIPVASTLHGQVVRTGGVFSAAYLVRQARERVNFLGALEDCRATGLANDQAVWIEMGPSPVCLSMVRATLEVPVQKLLPTMKPKESNWSTISASLAAAYNLGLSIKWAEYHREYLPALRLLSLPSYAFDLKDYWITFTGESSEKPQAAPVQLSSFVHDIEKESINGQEASAEFVAHVSEPQLLEAIRGHLIDGFPFCPSCVLWELAYTAAKYLYSKSHPGQTVPAMHIVGLEFPHPLVVADDGRGLAIAVDASASANNGWTACIAFTLRRGSEAHNLATCQVRFDDRAKPAPAAADWAQLSFFVAERMAAVRKAACAGHGHRLRKRIAYRLFENLVGYGPRFQGMDDVALTDDLVEAVATVTLTPAAGAGPFASAGGSPYWLDQLIQVAGFVLNANLDGADTNAYLLIGFESYRLREALAEGETYTSYVRMAGTDADGFVRGDAYVFRGATMVAVCAGIKAQRIPRDVLRYILTQASSASASPTSNNNNAATTRGPEQRRSARQSSGHGHTPSSSAGAASSADGSEQDTAALILAAVVAETGVALEELVGGTRFADVGVDSLMSIAIVVKLQKANVATLPASFFSEHQTVDEVVREFGK